MIQAPAPAFLKRSKLGFAARGAGLSLPAAWSSRSVHEVEIVVHDLDSTRILLEYAAPLFSVEVVPGSAWTVRLQRPSEGGWVQELQSLIERWLESARLPCAKVLCGGRSYLIRTSLDISRPSRVTDITGTPMPASVPRA
jgi:hypothetical protein